VPNSETTCTWVPKAMRAMSLSSGMRSTKPMAAALASANGAPSMLPETSMSSTVTMDSASMEVSRACCGSPASRTSTMPGSIALPSRPGGERNTMRTVGWPLRSTKSMGSSSVALAESGGAEGEQHDERRPNRSPSGVHRPLLLAAAVKRSAGSTIPCSANRLVNLGRMPVGLSSPAPSFAE
jgi:hypothetical protein